MASDLTMPQRLRVYAATLSDGDTANISLDANELRALAHLHERYSLLKEYERALCNKESVLNETRQMYDQHAARANAARARYRSAFCLCLCVFYGQFAVGCFLALWVL